MPTLALPTLTFLVHDDGSLYAVGAWSPEILIAADLLAHADGRRLAVRGDEVTIRCTNGGAVYALGPVIPSGQRIARLLRSW